MKPVYETGSSQLSMNVTESVKLTSMMALVYGVL